jgi:hypothetical protein
MADARHHAIGQRHQRHKGQHHRAHRHGQLHAGLCAFAGGHDDVGGAFFGGTGSSTWTPG